jgi:hypothetical protein
LRDGRHDGRAMGRGLGKDGLCPGGAAVPHIAQAKRRGTSCSRYRRRCRAGGGTRRTSARKAQSERERAGRKHCRQCTL